MNEKECKTCHLVKPLTDFSLRADNADGHHSMCRQCRAAQAAAYSLAKKNGEPVRTMEREPTGWPVPAPADLSVQLLGLHAKRAYGAIPGQLMARIG